MKMVARVNSKYRFRNSGGSAQSVYGYVLDSFCECDRIRPEHKYRPGEGLRVHVLFVQCSRRIVTDGSLFVKAKAIALHIRCGLHATKLRQRKLHLALLNAKFTLTGTPHFPSHFPPNANFHCCVAALLLCCAATLLRCCFAALLRFCAVALLRCVFAALLLCCAAALLHCCVAALLLCNAAAFTSAWTVKPLGTCPW
jgi:hypothetical protein